MAVGGLVAAAWSSGRDSDLENGDTAEIAAPLAPDEVFPSEPERATRGSTMQISGVEIPGIGAVVAGFDLEGAEYLMVSEQWFSGGRSILWRRDPAAWVVAGAIDAPVTHAAEWQGQIVAAGSNWILEETFVHFGAPDDPVSVQLEGSNELAFRVEALGDHVAVYSQSRDPRSELTSTVDLRGPNGFTARLSADGLNWTALPESVFDLAETSRGLLAVGERGLEPRIWRVEDGDLVETDLAPPSEYRPVSVLESDGEIMILAISRGLGRDGREMRVQPDQRLRAALRVRSA